MQVGFKSDRGMMRAKNEDAFFVMPEHNFFTVADGVGGSNAGEIASRTAVNEMAKCFQKKHFGEHAAEEEIRDFLLESLDMINAKIYFMALKHMENTGMATTMVAVFFHGGKAYFMNIGDSRAYILRDDKLFQISEDHTYINSLLKQGLITEEEAKLRQDNYKITRAIGAEKDVHPDFYTLDIKPDDIVLLSTDGLHGAIDDIAIEDVLRDRKKTIQERCELLIELANRAGGFDNITAICVQI